MDKAKKKRKTVGELSLELLKKQPQRIKALEQSEAMLEDYMKNLLEAVDMGYKKYQGDFYIHVETKKERLVINVVRNYFIPRKTCPTPNYDQSVFKYNRSLGRVEYMWTIPDRETCFYLKEHALEIPPEERQLLNFVLQFDDSTLFRLCKKFNGEKLDSPLLEN